MSTPVTALIATRNRGAAVVRAVETILENGHPEFEVLVIDQSDDDRTAAGMGPIACDPRVRYLRSPTVGLAAAHNVGLARAANELVAVTDDDCTVPRDWLERLVDAFGVDRRVGMVLGNVHAAHHDPAEGLVPTYVRREPFRARDMRHKHRVEGIGACMGIRRGVWREVGGFDEALGPGSVFRSGCEGDLAIRVLAAGYHVYETPDFFVVHHGLRPWPEVPSLVRGYWYGTGGMLAKHLKCRTPRTEGLLARLGWRWLTGRSPGAAGLGGDWNRLLRLGAFLRGFRDGIRTPVDRARRCYAGSGYGSRRPGASPERRG